MDFSYIGNGIDVVVIDNFYTESQLQQTIETCITLSAKFVEPEKTSGATLLGKHIKSNSGVFVDTLPINIDILKSKEFTDSLIKQCSFYKVFRELKETTTLVSLYNDGDYYGKHIDSCIFTLVVYINALPKMYSGGDLILHSCYATNTATIESLNNRAIIFPSCTPHEVTAVKGSGRFCISHFIK